MLTKEQKQNWIDALRSGKYQQTSGTLKRDLSELGSEKQESKYGYCCLGVFCEINKIELDANGSGIKNLEEADDSDTYKRLNYLLFGTRDMPRKAHDVDYSIHSVYNLIAMNDCHGEFQNNRQNFSQIADWIEQNIKTID